MTLIAEDLLLLLLDDETGKVAERTYLDVAIGGAVLTELAMLGAVRVPEKRGWFNRPKVELADVPPVDDPVLARALEIVSARRRTAQDLVKALGKGTRPELFARLVADGLVSESRATVLGIFGTTRFPVADAAHEAALRERIGAALVQGQEPDQSTAAVIAVLSAIDQAHKVVDRQGLTRGEVKKRAKAIADGNWAAEAVRAAVRAAQAATTAAMTAATSAAVMGGSAASS